MDDINQDIEAVTKEHDQSNASDLELLGRLAEGKSRALEIGCYLGASTVAILDGMGLDGHITVIDTFKDNDNEDGLTNINRLRLFNHRTKPYRGQVSTIIGRSPESLPEDKFDFIHIDGSHDYFDIMKDLGAAVHLLEMDVGAVIVVHNYDENHPDIMKAVNGYFTPSLINAEGRTAWIQF